jgi:hypothetical protein
MEASMPGYEIRVVTRNYETSKSFIVQQTDATAAVRRACTLKPEGQGVEVWDGIDCIYADYRNQPIWATDVAGRRNRF